MSKESVCLKWTKKIHYIFVHTDIFHADDMKAMLRLYYLSIRQRVN